MARRDDDDEDDDDGGFSDRPPKGKSRRRDDDVDDDDRDDDDRPARRKKKKRGKGSASARARLMGPAIGLMCVVGLHLLVMCIFSPFVILAIVGQGAAAMQGRVDLFQNPVVQIIQITISFAIQGFMLFGAIQMYKGKMFGVCVATCVLACIPCFCSSCYILGIPFGIWAIVVMMDEDVKASFLS